METDRHIPRISEVLYVGLCGIIGTPTQVKIRRDVMDTEEMIHQSPMDGRIMTSGSYREGFRLKTSDIDYMLWRTDNIIICDLSQIPPYNPSQTLILMESHDTPPGFAKLQLLTPTKNQCIRQSCVSVSDKVYISSSLYREATQNILQSNPLCKSATLHGPCSSGSLGPVEYDYACCFSCQHWPLPACQWIDRCQRQGWPSPQVLQDIIMKGCHFVAIGSGKSTSAQECETQWRISFSQAEYKLVYSMNHTQFLCYGLLKIFLKEVLNVGLKDPLLCSYFMKTTLFWQIQKNTIFDWHSKNILHCVWACFKYLTQCVYRGEFPNFFIPQNNMFINKIHGAAQKQLFLRLLTLYNMGFSCLLLSPSLYKILAKAILNHQFQVSTVENILLLEVELDMELYKEMYRIIGICINDSLEETSCVKKSIENLYQTIPASFQFHFAVLSVMRNISLLRHAFFLVRPKKDNNMHTTDSGSPIDMLISAAESGFISDTLYVAMYHYNKNRYTEALYYIERTKQKLSQPYVLYINTKHVNRERYMEAVGGMSLIDKIRKAVSMELHIDKICCIDELRQEVYVNKQNGFPYIYVSPLVMTHMLSFLCHHHLGDRLRSRQSIDDLQTLLHYDDGQYINPKFRDISWQMLGVCEQIQGDKERALYSYQQSSKQYPRHRITTASQTRIQNITSKQIGL